MFDWRRAISSSRLQHQVMLAESLRQFSRMISSSVPVLLLLEGLRREPAVAEDVITFAQELLAQPLDPGTLSASEVPLACCAYVLSRIGDPDAYAVVSVIARRHERELGWTPEFAELCMHRASPVNAGTWVAVAQTLSLSEGGDAPRLVGGASTVDDRAPNFDVRLQAAA